MTENDHMDEGSAGPEPNGRARDREEEERLYKEWQETGSVSLDPKEEGSARPANDAVVPLERDDPPPGPAEAAAMIRLFQQRATSLERLCRTLLLASGRKSLNSIAQDEPEEIKAYYCAWFAALGTWRKRKKGTADREPLEESARRLEEIAGTAPQSTASRGYPILDDEHLTITLRGEESPIALTEDQYGLVRRLVEARGGWRNGAALTAFTGQRADQIIKGRPRSNGSGERRNALPPEIGELIESGGPKGYRWVGPIK